MSPLAVELPSAWPLILLGGLVLIAIPEVVQWRRLRRRVKVLEERTARFAGSRRESKRSVSTAPMPERPEIKTTSPVFVDTHRGDRYQLGYASTLGEPSYVIWEARTRKIVDRHPATDDGWRTAWERYVELEPEGR